MQVTLNGQHYTYLPLQNFRLEQQLPDEFTLAHFEPKNWAGLGSIAGAGQPMAEMRQTMLEAVPPTLRIGELFALVEALTDLFHQEFSLINPHVGLQEVEVEFAVAGLADILRGVAFKLMQLHQMGGLAEIRANFDFEAVYQAWLDSGTRLSSQIHLYNHAQTTYQVQVIYNPYGRVGLKVQANGQAYYVADMSLACPAAAYMAELCRGLAQKMCVALSG